MLIAFMPRRVNSAPEHIETDDDLPRGIRNNNPGNIRYGVGWVGEIGKDDAGYAVFDTAIHGIRAMARNLHTGFVRDDEDTVKEVIHSWAPPIENNTTAYVDHVSRVLNVKPDTPLSYQRDVEHLIRAIILHENGMQPYDDFTIREGIRRA